MDIISEIVVVTKKLLTHQWYYRRDNAASDWGSCIGSNRYSNYEIKLSFLPFLLYSYKVK